MMSDRVRSLCAEYDVEIVAKNVAPGPRRTRAPMTIEFIWRRHGEAHIRMVMATLTETRNNHAVLDESTLWAASDLVRACGAIVETRTSEWLELWDAIPVDELHAIAAKLSGTVRVRDALAGMCFERIVRRFGPNAAQPDLFDDRGPYGEAAYITGSY